MRYKLGDRVFICENSRYYLGDDNNPIGVEGTITGIIDRGYLYNVYNLYIMVRWDNGGDNYYHHTDLIYSRKSNKFGFIDFVFE